MQIHRLFEIVYLLLDKKKVTAKELACRFEVSERTIYRDVEVLSSAGIPVYTVKGKGGGISLVEDFVLNKSLLSEEEQREILYALQSLEAVGGRESDRLLSRLGTLFQKEEGGWIDVDFSHWGSDAEEKARFSLLKAALLERRRIVFDYYSAYGEKTRRVVEPVKLCFKGRAWYLQAYCLSRKDFRMFRISRMEELTLTEETFSPHTSIPPVEAPIDGAVPVEVVELVLRIAPRYAYRAYDEFPRRMITREKDGSLLVRSRMPRDSWISGYLLSYGSGIQVLEPQWLRKEMAEKIAQMQKLYADIIQ